MSRYNIPRLVAFPVVAMAAISPAVATDYLSAEQAQRALFPAAQSFSAFPVLLNAGQLAQIRRLSGTPQRTAQPRVWRAVSGGRTIGWVIVDDVVGKHEFITYATGISLDGHVVGIEIMTYRESKGGQVSDPRWRERFRGKTLADPFRLEKDVPNISGATLSSRNITDGVKRLLAVHAVALAQAR